MLKITGSKIELTRGDTLYLTADLKNADGTDYEPAQGDKVWFRMKKHASDTESVIYKEFDHSTMTIKIESEDTANLIVGYNYPYNIRALRDNEDVATPILGVFVPTQEVG